MERDLHTAARPHERSPEDHVRENLAQPAIRWPRPSAATLGYVALWVAGAVVAVAVPYVVVPVGQTHASVGPVWTAFGFTVIGSTIMIIASALMFRRSKDAGVFVIGCIPAVATIIGGVILSASKLTH